MSRADRSSEQVEFTVKPEEDLILEGTERTITRVHAGTPYSCLMLKTQRFSSLFRHYAKHHGLRKDDLAFYFTEELQNEDTPESVFLQKNDEIVVRKRRKPVAPPPVCPDSIYFRQMRQLLDDTEHKDVTFIVGPCKEQVKLAAPFALRAPLSLLLLPAPPPRLAPPPPPSAARARPRARRAPSLSLARGPLGSGEREEFSTPARFRSLDAAR